MNWLLTAVAAFCLTFPLFWYLGYSGVATLGAASAHAMICVAIWSLKHVGENGSE